MNMRVPAGDTEENDASTTGEPPSRIGKIKRLFAVMMFALGGVLTFVWLGAFLWLTGYLAGIWRWPV